MNKELIEKLWAEVHPGYTGEHKVVVRQDLQQIVSIVLDAQAQNFAEIRNCLSVIMLSNDKQVQEYSARLLKELEAINKLR